MPHVAFVPFTGLRVREAELLELGMSLPGLQERAGALSELPALGLLTLAGMTPDSWSCSYHGTGDWDEHFVDRVLETSPIGCTIEVETATGTGLQAELRYFQLETDVREGTLTGFLLAELGADRKLGSLYFRRPDRGE